MNINICKNSVAHTEKLDDGFPVSVKFIETNIIFDIIGDESIDSPVKYKDITYGKGKTIRIKVSDNDYIGKVRKIFEKFSGMKLLEVTSKSENTVFEIIC
ncbi:MAG: hypothetical protein U0M08_00805 [Clostridia bacterium]|nr:hypothetical protein [Clostridia bacterium]